MKEDATGELYDVLPEFNMELYKQTLKWAKVEQELAEADPEYKSEWAQNNWLVPKDLTAETWDCGTACCFAGRVALDAGYRPPVNPQEAAYLQGYVKKDGQGRLQHVSDIALDLLGLTPSEDVVFSSDNTIQGLENWGRRIAASRGMDWGE